MSKYEETAREAKLALITLAHNEASFTANNVANATLIELNA